MTDISENDPLFSPRRDHANSAGAMPLIVIGMPRSGSSFLSHILSQIPDWYVFDDLYLHRKAREINAQNPMTSRDVKELVHFLGWQIRARLRFGLYAIPNVTEEEVAPLDAALEVAFRDQRGSWADLQQEWMLRLAKRSDCNHWGYKMPGAFRYIPALLEFYPNAIFMFVMRDPHKVLASYKHMPMTSQDGDPRRYHPIAYAVYWRMAVRSYLKNKELLGARLTLVQFENLVSEPQKTAHQISTFLGAEPPRQISVPPKPNSSFSKTEKGTNLTGLETWILRTIAKREMAALGYKPQNASIKPSDFADFFRVTLRFTGFHLRAVFAKLRRT